MQELKIRLPNSQEIEEKLKVLGTEFVAETHFVDTYFKQIPGHVLKLGTNNHGSQLIQLELANGKFKVISKQNIADAESQKKELSDKYGIKTVLQGKRRLYKLGDLELLLNFIDEVGQFLILTGENPTEEFITESSVSKILSTSEYHLMS
jgi:adenylate cyclase class IV